MGNAQSTDKKNESLKESRTKKQRNEQVTSDQVTSNQVTSNQVKIDINPTKFETISEYFTINQIDTKQENNVIIEVMDEQIPYAVRENKPTLQRANSVNIQYFEDKDLEYTLTHNNYHKYNHYVVKKYDITKALEVHNSSDVMDSTIIVDETGSMKDMGQEPIESVNEYIKVQRESGFPVKIRIIRFADHISIKEGDVADPALNIDDYYPSGMTALFDAVIFGILYGTKPQHMIILTDGKDNTSVRTLRELNTLIQRAESCGWKFTFIGCNKEAYDQGSQFTMSSEVINIDREGAPPRPMLHAMRTASHNSASCNRDYNNN